MSKNRKIKNSKKRGIIAFLGIRATGKQPFYFPAFEGSNPSSSVRALKVSAF